MSREYPRARRDLQTSFQKEGGQEYVVVKDPRSRRYFRLRSPEWWLVEQMDGSRGIAELEAGFAERFGSQLPPGMLAGFVAKLEGLHVLETLEAEKASSALAERQSADSGFGRLLFIKIKAFDPDAWLARWARRLRFLLRPWFWPVSLALIVIALGIVAGNRDDFGFDPTSLLHAGSIVALIVVLFVVIALHEIAHGIVCRHLGGHVHEMGLLLLYFQPCVYCDVSDAWLFREKWKKLLVTFAGAYFQVVLGAVGVIGWRLFAFGTVLNRLSWLLAVVSLVNVLFNFNPLIKLDGYYLLSDWLGIPNLRTRSFGWLGHRLFGREWSYAVQPTRRERRIYWWYGVLAVIYSVALLGYVGWWVAAWMVAQWRGAGLVLFIAVVALIFRRPVAWAMKRTLPPSLYNVRKTILWSVVGVALAAALFVPYPYRVGSPARLEPWAQMTITASNDGFIRSEWYQRGDAQLLQSNLSKMVTSGFTTLGITHAVKVGDSVTVGDTLLRVSGDQFVSLREEARAALDAKQAELDLLMSPPRPEEVAEAQARVTEEQSLLTQKQQVYDRTKSMYDRNVTPLSVFEQAESDLHAQESRLESAKQSLALLKAPPKLERVRQLRAEIAQAQRQLAFYSGQLDATVFTSPVNGRVVRLADEAGEICRVARTDSMRCVMAVDEAYVPLLAVGQPVTLKIPSRPFDSYEGQLTWVSTVGDFGVHKATFTAVAGMANGGALSPGMTGYAKVNAGSHTLAWRVFRRVVRFFRIEFWSWW